ncbi:hypothetical protein C6380_07255 [Pseudomonas syringae pv. actinidiae]|nr:hypothetical protein [Pseudomonas syringae pv. theae]NVL62755.1 hypothetical protein [Pseudomonas syringae pv. actinidiae]PBK54445.1 hypothetical protein BUE61_09880 [Pseudomonas syringae pv. actinidiae]PBK57015.1 hypothetical protein BUE60_02080 [Pseudomonas syringae pv. actinidiae]RJX54414.1 hypothetical protein C6383_26560 [Pseudomonas syringae pv. actinidiae]
MGVQRVGHQRHQPSDLVDRSALALSSVLTYCSALLLLFCSLKRSSCARRILSAAMLAYSLPSSAKAAVADKAATAKTIDLISFIIITSWVCKEFLKSSVLVRDETRLRRDS